MARIFNGLLLLYPLLVHAAIVADSRVLEFAALALLACNVLGPKLVRLQAWAWAVCVVCVLGSAGFVTLGDGRLFLYAAAVVSPLALMWFFARTLVPGQTPLVTRIADDMSGPLSPKVERYTRHVTELWVAALAGFAIANFLLALLAAPVIWSLFANFINYFIVGAVFLAEWLFRCWYISDEESMTWRDYLYGLIHLDIRQLLN